MKRTFSGLAALTRLSDRVMPYALVSVVLPLLVLAGFGLYAVIRYGYVLHLILVLIACTLLSSLGLLLARRRFGQKMGPAVREALEATPRTPDYWRPQDREVQQALMPELRAMVAAEVPWQELPHTGLAVLRLVASRYDAQSSRAHWAFTAPELLAIIEQVSRRYRRVLKAHVPGVDHLRLSTLLSLNEQVERYGPLARKAFNLYRAARLISPQGLVAEALTQLRGEVFSGLSDELQNRLKYLLLLEVLRAAIDLYGGHFRLDDDQLQAARVTERDDARKAPPLDPVRICLVGQVGAGKSSLINALTGSLNAEVSALPATDGVAVYECAIEGAPNIRLVDLPGLDGSEAVDALVFKEVCECDLIIWALKANQPARALDKQFRERLKLWFAKPENLEHEPAAILGILTQGDRLVPAGSWPAAFSLDDGSKAARAAGDALAYNAQLLDLPDLILTALPQGQPAFGLVQLQERLQGLYAKAVNVQLNRRRREAGAFSVSRELERIKRGAKGAFSLLR
ncbi:GTPase family protein [Pseudomonas massiliensis]|uniref:GTPase family protein n=1 Tax=Pseudomonas massiliensis TaxID=522492 RepID=UPI000A036C2C|nr:GTPase [Pseudomonas massiliensis]